MYVSFQVSNPLVCGPFCLHKKCDNSVVGDCLMYIHMNVCTYVHLAAYFWKIIVFNRKILPSIQRL